MDDHRKKAEEIANKFSHLFAITGGGTYSSWYRLIDEMENALRSTASKSEKDGWNKAVEALKPTYNKFEHLDKLLSDKEWLVDNDSENKCINNCLYELWSAIRSLIREGK
jgi:hypothetical protein